MACFVKNSKGVAPIIGLALMVAITVIFAAVAVSAFGADPLKKAPQADIRAVGESIGANTVIKLIHQGGDEVCFNEGASKIILSDSSGSDDVVSFAYLVNEDDRKFSTGDLLYLYLAGGKVCVGNSTLPNTDGTSIASGGGIINLKILDVSSQQMIADVNVNL